MTAELRGTLVSEGTLYNLINRASATLATLEQEIKAALENKAVIHHDETGARINGSIHWIHVVCTATLTVYYRHKRRNTASQYNQAERVTRIIISHQEVSGGIRNGGGVDAVCNMRGYIATMRPVGPVRRSVCRASLFGIPRSHDRFQRIAQSLPHQLSAEADRINIRHSDQQEAPLRAGGGAKRE